MINQSEREELRNMYLVAGVGKSRLALLLHLIGGKYNNFNDWLRPMHAESRWQNALNRRLNKVSLREIAIPRTSPTCKTIIAA